MPRTNTKQTRVSLDLEVFESVSRFAKDDERSFSNAVQFLVKKGLVVAESEPSREPEKVSV